MLTLEIKGHEKLKITTFKGIVLVERVLILMVIQVVNNCIY